MIRDRKQSMRTQIRRMRAGLSRVALAEAGQAVTERILALPELQHASRVLCYVSYRREVPTEPLIEALLARDLEVAVPRVTGAQSMEARRVVRPWVADPKGIPSSDGPLVEGIDLCICPGLAFDGAGRRLGYGGGFYDSWLAREQPVTIGVCVDGAFVVEVPAEAHDHRMDVVITPSRTCYTSTAP